MLKKIALKHFKSIYDEITLPLAPLTVFAGPNSSGKSTVIQSLLLVTQTVQSPVRSRSVVLNGNVLKLGEFDDILSDGAEPRSISIGFSLSPPRDPITRGAMYPGYPGALETIDCKFSFSGQSDNGELRQLQPRLDEATLRVLAGGDEPQQAELVVKRSALTVLERLRYFHVAPEAVTPLEATSLEYEISTPSPLSAIRGFYPLPRSSRHAGATLFHFLPSRLSIVYDLVDHQEERVLQYLTAGASPGFYYGGTSRESVDELTPEVLERLKPVLMPLFLESFQESAQLRLQAAFRPRTASLEDLEQRFSLESIGSFLRSLPTRDRRLIVARIAEKEPEIRSAVSGRREAQYDMTIVQLPPLIEQGVDRLTTYFTKFFKYLGPLRDEPKPVYPLAGSADPRDVGYKGEHTAAVLETFRNTPVAYYATASIGLEGPLNEPTVTTLYAAVLDWLQYMGIADQVKTQDLGKLGHELKVAAGQGESVHDLTHVGVGVSQVLPILVLALLADSGSTLVFEQPELHLHPRVQTRLGDFFVSLSRLGKQCLVETHSEYLINRLRFRSASDSDDWVSENTLLYFVEREKGRSTYRGIKINEFGVIEQWPAGFFDETEMLAASILKAGSNKRRRRTKTV